MWIGFYQQIATWFYFNDWINIKPWRHIDLQKKINNAKNKKLNCENNEQTLFNEHHSYSNGEMNLEIDSTNHQYRSIRKSKWISRERAKKKLQSQRIKLRTLNGAMRPEMGERAGAEPNYMAGLWTYALIENRLISVQLVRLFRVYIQCHIITFVM